MSSVGSEPSRKTLRTENSRTSYESATGLVGSTTAPPRGTWKSNSRSNAQFTERS